MKAMLTNDRQELVWEEVPDPVIGPDEVFVKIQAAGVNRADLLQRQGKYPPPPGCPEWMGLEISGIIEKTGENVIGWKAGDPVCALLGGGGYAEYAAVRADHLMPIPRGLSMAQAAALPEVFATAYLNLFWEGRLQSGETAFIPAGTSGLASAAIPLAKAFGARVITSVRSDESAERIRSLGADVVILSHKQDVAEALAQEEKNGTPVNVSMDCLCGETLGKSLPYMARGGYWIVIATLAGTETTVPLRPLMTKGLHLVGSTLRSRAPSFKAALLRELTEKVWPLIEEGKLRPSVCRILPIEEAAQAHRLLERGARTGKVVLRVSGKE